MTLVLISFQALSEYTWGRDAKSRKKYTDLQAALIQVNEWIEVEVALQVVWKGPHIFIYPPPNSQCSVIITTIVEKVMDIKSADDIYSLLNYRFQVGHISVLAFSYLGRASGRLHDSILTKFFNTFFVGLPEANRPSSNSRANTTERKGMARLVHKEQEFYCSRQYNVALQTACHNAISEIIATVCQCAGTIAASVRAVTSFS